MEALYGADEVHARRFAGWITRVARLTGMSHTTIRKGINELQSAEELKGRKKVEIKDPNLGEDLEMIMNKKVDLFLMFGLKL